jgi:hypothetical protein
MNSFHFDEKIKNLQIIIITNENFDITHNHYFKNLTKKKIRK